MSAKRKPPDPTFVLRGQNTSIRSACFGDTSDRLWTANEAGDLLLYSMTTRRPAHTIKSAHSTAIISLQYVNEPQIVVSRGRMGIVKAWDASTYQEKYRVLCNTASFCNAHACTSNGNTFVAVPSEEKGEVLIFNSKTEKQIAKVSPGPSVGMLMHLKLYEVGDKLIVVTAHENGGVYFWDAMSSSDNAITSIKDHKEPALCFNMNKSLKRGISGGADNILSFFNVDLASGTSKSNTQMLSSNGVNDASIRPDEKICVTAGWDNRVRVFGWKKRKPLAILKGHSKSVYAVAFAPEGNRFASVSEDGNVAVWNIY